MSLTNPRVKLEESVISFAFPDGFNSIRLIERLRLLEMLSDPECPSEDRFDMSYDITMQMLSGKRVEVHWNNEGSDTLAFTFRVSGRYMDLSAIPQLERFPCIAQWLVHRVVEAEAKKLPLSLEALTRESGEPLKKSRSE